MKVSGFCDFCVPFNKNQKILEEILQELVEVGYKNVAVEQSVTMKTNKEPIPAPVDLTELRKKFNGKIEILNRLTVVYGDPQASFSLNKSPHYKKFDIIATLPTTESALQFSCQTFQCDIITYNSEEMRMKVSRKSYYFAVRRNVFFELKYSPAISDSSQRRDLIRKGQMYHLSGKSKGIIISSGAQNKFEIRSPNDVSNLGLIFGLSEEQARNSILGMCRKLLLSAQCRKSGRYPMLMSLASSDSSDEDSDSAKDSNEEMNVGEDSSSSEVEQSSKTTKRTASKSRISISPKKAKLDMKC